ncbi:MAG: M20/M25/M40 family metallo-hydrolase, partial [Candidatus Baldrarchaeia archaeon]
VEIDAKGLMDAWVTTDEKVIEKFRQILREVTGKEPKVIVELGGTDGVHLIDRMPVIQFGALRGDNNAHGLNEFVYIDDLKLTKEFVKKTILTAF